MLQLLLLLIVAAGIPLVAYAKHRTLQDERAAAPAPVPATFTSWTVEDDLPWR